MGAVTTVKNKLTPAIVAEILATLCLLWMYPLLASGQNELAIWASLGVGGGFAWLAFLIRRPGMFLSNLWATMWAIIWLGRTYV